MSETEGSGVVPAKGRRANARNHSHRGNNGPVLGSNGLARSAKGLRPGTLDTSDMTMLGMASTAPIFALAVTLGLIISRVGSYAPLTLVLGVIPVFLVVLAFRELNSLTPDCGTAFTWNRQAFGPWVGWVSGFAMVIAGIVVLVNLAHVASKYLWFLISGGSWEVSGWVTIPTALGIIAFMCWVNAAGIHIGENTQRILSWVQYLALAVFAMAMIVTIVANAPAEGFDIAWFDPVGALSNPGLLWQGVLLAIFLFWGWDTCFSVNEESDDPARNPGRSAMFSTLALLLVYVSLTVLLMMFASTDTAGFGLANPENSGDVLTAVRELALGPWGWVVLLAVIASALSGSQATVLPVTRSLLAMGGQHALPSALGRVNPRTQTPRVASWSVAVVAGSYYLLLCLLGADVLVDSANAVTLFIAAYYAMTAFACVWIFRSTLGSSARNLWLRGILPALGGLILLTALLTGIFQWANPEFTQSSWGPIGGTLLVAIALALAGVLLALWSRFGPRTREYFSPEANVPVGIH